MNYPNTPEYRFDISGVHPDNLIRQEATVIDSTDIVKVPRHAPFYHESFQAFLPNGELMVKDKHYRFFSIEKELSRYTGKAVGVFIEILDKSITKCFFTYQVVGSLSLWTESLQNIFNNVSTSDKPVEWDNIANKPTLFDPEVHVHDVVYDLYGFKDLADSLWSLIEWFNPQVTYNREAIGKFTHTNIITNTGNFVGVNTETSGLMRLYVNVNTAYEALSNPPPHLAFFQQQVLNAITYVTNYVNSYLAELNSHIANTNNPHGVGPSDLGLGLRDNYKVLTLASDADNVAYSSKKLVTPAWFANIAKSVKGRTDNYVQRGVLPLSYFGDTTFIPPVFDSKVYGLGIAAGYGVLCLERGGWLSALVNAMDTENDLLMFLKFKGYSTGKWSYDSAGGLSAQTKYPYTAPYLTTNSIKLNTVLKGGDYRWMVVGDTRTNKWFLVKTNGTLEGKNHTFYPITLPITITKVSAQTIQTVITDNAIYFVQNDLASSNRLDLSLWSLSLTSLSTTSNTVNPMLVTTVNGDGTTTASVKGAWRPFPYVTNSDGKVTRWFTNFTTPLSGPFNNRGVLAFIRPDANGNDLYFRLYYSPTVSNGTSDAVMVLSSVFKFTKQSDGSYFPTIVKGDPTKAFDVSKWDFTLVEDYANHINEPTNAPFLKEFLDTWSKGGLNAGNATCSSRLSNGDSATLSSVHWTFYPLELMVFKKSQFNLDDDTTFKTGSAYPNSAMGGSQLGFINNIGASGVSSYLACYSNAKTQSDSNNDYELARAELGGSKYGTIARKRSGDRSLTYTPPSGTTWNRAPSSTDIRKTDINSNCFRLNVIDDSGTDAGNGNTVFGFMAYNAQPLSGDSVHSATYDYTVDLTSDPDLIKFKENYRLVFSSSLIKKFIGDISTAAIYDGDQSNWNIYWFSNNGGRLTPIMVVCWVEMINGVNTLRMSMATLSANIDFTNRSLYTKSANGIYELQANANFVSVGKIITTNLRTVDSSITNKYWLKDSIAHIQPGHVGVYVNSSGERTLIANTSMYLGTNTSLSAGSALVPMFIAKFSDAQTPTGDIWTATSWWDGTSTSANPVKNLGILINRGLELDTYVGGTVIPGQVAGKSYADAINGINTDDTSRARYHLFDLRMATNYVLYLSSAITIVVNGASRTIPAQRTDLTTIKANPANTTFYLYLQESDGTGTISVRLSPMAESSRMVYLGTVVTNATGIASINTTPAFTMNGYRISENPMGAAIPASTGDITGNGTFLWGTQ